MFLHIINGVFMVMFVHIITVSVLLCFCMLYNIIVGNISSCYFVLYLSCAWIIPPLCHCCTCVCINMSMDVISLVTVISLYN